MLGFKQKKQKQTNKSKSLKEDTAPNKTKTEGQIYHFHKDSILNKCQFFSMYERNTCMW